jgi:hypothetical protein
MRGPGYKKKKLQCCLDVIPVSKSYGFHLQICAVIVSTSRELTAAYRISHIEILFPQFF